MKFIEWNDQLSVGIKKIDDQHKELISVINTLHEAMSVGKGKEYTAKVIEKLFNYVEIHFNTEEELFEEYEYSFKEEHCRHHNDFIDKTLNFKRKLDSDKMFLSVEIMDFLGKWITGHIMSDDKKYSSLFREKELL